MQTCKLCGHTNPDDLTICLNCASNLGENCPSCGSAYSAGNRFCGQCGARLVDESQNDPVPLRRPRSLQSKQEGMLLDLREKIPTSLKTKIHTLPAELSGQRREITVVVVEIDHSSNGTGRLDSEELYLMVEEIMHLLVEVIYRFEGTVDKLSKDGLMAVFGIPLNHENDPERAVRASLDMHTAILKARERYTNRQVTIDLRIGVNTGQVITGRMGSDYHMEYSVVGDTISMANRLLETAGPGMTLVSFQTYQRTHPIFEYRAFSGIKGRDNGESQPAYLPTEIRSKPGRIRGLPGLQVPMVGRSEDLRQMHEALNKVREGKNYQILLINGEAGLGKSRLVEEFQKSLVGQPVKVFQGTCSSYMRITPYRVVSNIIRDTLRLSEVDNEETQRKALKDHLSRINLDNSEVLPYLLYVLDLPQEDPVLESRLKLLSPSMLQHQVHSALRLFMIAEASSIPTVLIFDDLHWVDPASTDFLNYLMQAIEGEPIMLILVARSYEDQSIIKIENLALQGDRFILELKPLPVQETRILVDQLIPEKTLTANKIKEQIVFRSAGNPYYVEELVRILMDCGGMTRGDQFWRVTGQAESVLNNVPGTLKDILMARFDRLPTELRRLAQNAAVLGQLFRVQLLNALMNIDPGALTQKLHELVKRDFLIYSLEDGESSFSFKHPLLHEAIYNTLFKSDLRRLHLHIAQAAEESRLISAGERNDTLAHHYAESSEPEKAIPYLIAAAENAIHRYANQNAVEHYQRLLQILQVSPDASESYLHCANIGLGKALKYTGEFQEAKICLEEGVNGLLVEWQKHPEAVSLEGLVDGLSELADLRTREGGFDEALELLQKGMGLLGESAYEQHPILWRRLADRIAWVYFRYGRLEEAFRQADLALYNVILWEQDDPITLASLNNTLGGIYWIRTKYMEAVQHVERSLEIYKNLGYAWGMAIAYTNMGVLYFSVGYWQKAVENFEHADTLRKEHGYTLERPTNLKNLGETLICMGDFDRARETLETSLEISQRLGMKLAEAYAEIGLSRLAVYEEDYIEAQSHLEVAKDLLEAAEDEKDDRHVQILTLGAMIQAGSGDFQNGLRDAVKAYELAKMAELSTEEVDALRTLGVINVQLKDFTRAEYQLRESAQLAEGQKDRYHQGLALFELGQAYARRGMDEPARIEVLAIKAREAYMQAIEHFEALGARHDHRKVQIALNQLPILQKQALYPGNQALNADMAPDKAQRPAMSLPEGGWYQATVVYLKFLPQQNQDADLVYETYALLMPPLIEMAQENGAFAMSDEDGLTILFGAPVMHEDDPERAIETAMQIINFYQELNSQIQVPVSLKLSVTAGRVVGGEVDLGREESFMATGEVIDQARMLIEGVPPGQVWVSQTVRNVTAHRYEYRPVPAEWTAYLSDQEIFQLTGLREQIRPVRGLIGIKTPFIGREEELGAMWRISDNLNRGQGGLIWIEGEAGIGKSRLMREFANLLGEQRPLGIWVGTCTARRSERAFSLFSDVLYQVFELQPTFTSEQIYSSIDEKLKTWPKEIDEARPFLQFLLGLQPTDNPGERILAWEPEQLRRQTFIQLRKLISTLTTQEPLLLLLDDLQWIDSISADLLLFLSYLTSTHPLLIVATQRSTETSASENTLAKLKRMHIDRTTRLYIQPFTANESQELLRGLLSSAHMPSETLRLIIQQSGGNPYYIEEFIRMLLEQKYLQVSRDKLVVNQEFEIDKLSIPASLEALIRARVDSLPSIAKKLIQSAAVIGQKIDLELLSNVSQVARLEANIDHLRNRGMLVQESETGYWHFSHPLIETTVYSGILRAHRQALHSRAAQALETQWTGSEAEHAEDLAYHYQRANEHNKAIYYLILAGERAAARFANEEALGLFEQANELLEGITQPKDVDRYRIAVGLGSVYLLVGNYDASVVALQTALEFISSSQLTNALKAGLYRLLGEAMQKKGDQEGALGYFRQALEVLDKPEDRQAEEEAARIQARLGWSFFLNGDIEGAKNACDTALIWAEKAGNPNALAMVENLIGGIYYRQGDFQGASQHTQQAMAYWEQIGYTWGVATSLGNLGILEVSAGKWEEAQEFLQRSLKLYQEIGDVEAIARAHNNLASLARDRGDLEVAEAHFRDSLAVAKPFQMAWHTANSTHGLAQVLLYRGQLEAAQQALSEGMEAAEEIRAQNMQAEMRQTHAELLLALNALEGLVEAAEAAAHLANESGNRVVEAGAWRVLAECRLRRCELPQAQEALSKAWQALTDSTDELESGRVHAQAGRIEMALGEKERAHLHFKAAQETFARLGAKRDLALLPVSP